MHRARVDKAKGVQAHPEVLALEPGTQGLSSRIWLCGPVADLKAVQHGL